MRFAALLATCIFFHFAEAQNASFSNLPYTFPLKQLEKERGEQNYDLNQIIDIIEDSIHHKNQVIIPQGSNQFERLLFTARRIQHNDSQLVAVKLFQNLLEFKFYRSRGEELYIKMLLAKSLDYIGADQLAYERMSLIFPELVAHIEDPYYQAYCLDQYSDLLIDIDSLEDAVEVYYDIIEICSRSKDSLFLFDARNNLGFTFLKLGKLDSASLYFRGNQNQLFKKFNPILYAFAYGNYAKLLLQKEQYDSVIYYCRKEEELLREANSVEGLEKLYQSLGLAFRIKGEIDSAEKYYSLSNVYSQRISRLDILIENYHYLINLKEKQRGTEALSEPILRYLSISDSIISRYEEAEELEELKISEFFRIYTEAQNSREEFEVLKRNNEQLSLIITSLAILLSILILLMLYRYYNRKQLALINQDLKAKNQDLERYNQIVTESNHKNELLLKELHHRVKNNLQIVSSLFRLQMNAKKLSKGSKEIFQIAQDRIHSISLLHKKIYQSEEISFLDFKSYLEELSQEIVESNQGGLEIELNIPKLEMSIDTALPLGLIFNELFTNSIKHAKPEGKLRITIDFDQLNGKESLIYRDNGQNVNIEAFKESGEDSLGYELIELLSRQIEAQLFFDNKKKSSGFLLEIRGDFAEVRQA